MVIAQTNVQAVPTVHYWVALSPMSRSPLWRMFNDFNSPKVKSISQTHNAKSFQICPISWEIWFFFIIKISNFPKFKMFTFSKIRKFIDKSTANIIYKQTILPILDYGGFLLDSCTQKLRDDLQKLQNKALRIIHGFKLVNAPGIENLHNMSNIISLRQRREKQLLHLMLWYSKYDIHLLKRNRITRLQEKVNFKVLPLKTRRYINSPVNRGNVLWNQLTQQEQTTFSNQMFKNILDRKYKVYKA